MIIEKNNKKIITYDNVREKFISDDIYALKTFNFLNLDYNHNKTQTIRKKFYNIFTNNIFTPSTSDYYKELVNNTYKKLIKITNKSDLISLYGNFKRKLLNADQIIINSSFRSIDALYNKYEDIVLNEFTHKIINKHFYYLIKEEKRNNTIDIAQKILLDANFDVLGNYNEQIPKKRTNNIRAIAEMELIHAIYRISMNNKHKHLCFDCPVDLCDCPKIMDDTKKYIEEYDFINSGIQRYNDKTGELEDFYVTDCELFNKTKKTKKKTYHH